MYDEEYTKYIAGRAATPGKLFKNTYYTYKFDIWMRNITYLHIGKNKMF